MAFEDANGPSPAEVTSSALLSRFAAGCGLPFDATIAAQAIRRAIQEIPPTEPRAARRRLTIAAESLGMQLLIRKLTVREAIAVVVSDAPLAIYTVTASGIARWFVLAEARGKQGKIADPESNDSTPFRNADAIARTIGSSGDDEVLEWVSARPNSTLATISAPAGDANDGPSTPDEGDHDHHGDHKPPLKRVLELLSPDRRDIWIVALFAVGIGLFNLAAPVVAMAVVNTAAQQTLGQQVLILSAALLLALGLAAFLQVLQNVTVEYLQQRIFVRVADDLTYRLPRADVAAFDSTHGPELLNRFFDVLTVQKSSATLLLDGVGIVIQIVVGLVLLGFYDAALIGYDIVLIVCLLFMVFVLGRGAVSSAIRESKAKYAVAGWMEEIARHRIAFKLAGGPRFALEKGDQLTREYLLARQDHFRRVMRQFGFALFLQAAANAALLAIGGYLVAEGRLTLGQLVAAEIVVTLVVASFTKFGKQFESYYDLLAAADKLGHLIDIPLERSGGVSHLSHSDGTKIEAKQLSFSYGHGQPEVIHGLDLSLRPGERVALMGPNGSGKSTFVELLFGLRLPSSGRIEVDGLDLRDVRLESFREHAAIVKGVEIFEGTVLANIRMGREEIGMYDVRDALQRVGLMNAISELPHGLHTPLQTNGAPLSLGQINRLMLARAIAGQPRFLVLDETLDHMDSDLRETVLPAILDRNSRWTLLVVTHSDEVAKLCDRTILFDRTVPLTPAH